MRTKKVLITTPDYPPHRIGGISTFVLNLEKILRKLSIDYELCIWSSLSELKVSNTDQFDVIFNAHYMAATKIKHKKMVNFIHGGELFPYSPNFVKRIIKKVGHKKLISYIEKSFFNIFISNYTFNLFERYAENVDYARDIIHHNCIDVSMGEFISKSWDQKLVLCCFARDVPHKNIAGVIKLFEFLDEYHPEGAELYLTSHIGSSNPKIKNLDKISDDERELVYKKSHLNLLLSLDHSSRGQIEGFGLTILEAGKYGVPSVGSLYGGLPESIHHQKTGWSLVSEDENEFSKMYDFFKKHYSIVQRDTYKHTLSEHGLDKYEKLIESLL